MKKRITALLALVMVLGAFSGCQKAAPAPETTEPSVAVQTETAATEATTAPTEATTEATAEPAANDTVFKDGTWMAQCGPTSRYYFFENGGTSGRFVNMKDGSGADFAYVQTGDQGELCLGGKNSGAVCTVEVQDEDHITLKWENQPEEKMTYVCDLSADQFHFYTHEELAEMALEDYRAKNDPDDESLQAAAMDNGDGTSTIQIYQNLGDHNSTAAYYIVDRCTGEGQNISSGTDVDLTRGTQDLDIFQVPPDMSITMRGIPYLVLDETEFGKTMLLHPMVTIKNFRVVSLSYVENGDGYGFRVVEELYEAAAMEYWEDMALRIVVPETIPNVGVIYQDRYGVERLYTITYSGLDGSVLLIEQMLIS